jgi:hypothetical protein
MTRHHSRHSGNKFSVLPLTLKPRPKRNLRGYGVSKSTSVCRVPLHLPLSKQNRSCQTLKMYRRKWSIKNSTIHCRMSCQSVHNLVTLEPHVRRNSHYFNFYSILQSYTSAHIRRPADKSDAMRRTVLR